VNVHVAARQEFINQAVCPALGADHFVNGRLQNLTKSDGT
jgi:hypothetical protein